MGQAFHTQTLAELAAGLEKGDFSSVEITQALLDRIEQLDGALNAFVTVTGEQALAAARAADDARAAGNAGPLNGLPIAHKDIFCTRDVLTTCGSRMLENFVAPPVLRDDRGRPARAAHPRPDRRGPAHVGLGLPAHRFDLAVLTGSAGRDVQQLPREYANGDHPRERRAPLQALSCGVKIAPDRLGVDLRPRRSTV